MKIASVLGFVLLGMGSSLFGCGAEMAAEENEGGTVEFRDRFGSDGVFTVVRDENGNLGLSLAAPIGNHTPDLHTDLLGKSPAEMYQALHPGAQVPLKLRALSSEFMDRVRAVENASGAADDLPVHESLATFNSTVCKNLPSDTLAYYWKKIRCGYQAYPGAPPAAWNYYTGNTAAGWNETPGSAYHTNSNSTWKPVIPPWTYSWTQWNMTHEGAVIEMRPYDPAAQITGYYGVTVHKKTLQVFQ